MNPPKEPHRVEVLAGTPPPASKQPPSPDKIIAAFDALGVTVEQLEAKLGIPHDNWGPESIANLAALGKAIKAGDTTTFEEFEQPAEPEQPALDGVGE